MKKARKHVWFGTLVILCVLCAGAALVAAQAPAQTPSQTPAQQPSTEQTAPPGAQDPRYRLNVEVELVNVTATVLDEGGKYMDGLKIDDFQVFEDGVEQKVSFF